MLIASGGVVFAWVVLLFLRLIDVVDVVKVLLPTIRWSLKAGLINRLPDEGRGYSFVCSVGELRRGCGMELGWRVLS